MFWSLRCFSQLGKPDHAMRLSPPFCCSDIILSIVLLCAIGLCSDAFAIQYIGKNIYTDQCASCHGQAGEGHPDHFADPLYGDLSLDQLRQLIVDTMPEEDPEQCVGDEAAAVAKYVFESFYSRDAQKKLNAARIELSRLTVPQYRRSVAELIGSFGRDGIVREERGIEGDYFAARRKTANRRLAKQIDETIDFGTGVPHFDPTGKYEALNIKKKKGENKMNDGFSVYWDGGLIPSESGNHQVVVQSKNGFRLWVNDAESALIDRQVRSDEVLDHSATIYLLAGRVYTLKLEMFAYPDPPAKIRLLWKPPGKPLGVIPPTAFVRHGASEVAVVSNDFPADDASFGYERGVDVSRQWDSAATAAAIDVANWVAKRVWRLARTRATDTDATEKVRQFCRQFTERAFVTSLSNEDLHFYVGQHFEKELPIEDQVKRVVIMTLKSPRFLYPALEKRNKDDELARRMALALWDSLPDRRLYDLADRKKLSKPAVLASELKRMVRDPRSKQKLHSFFSYWLKTDKASNATKDKQAFPGFDEALVADLKESLFLYLDGVVWSETSDFRDLFLADYLVVNRRIADFYELGQEEGEGGFYKIRIDSEQRAGILTHPYLMTGFAYHKDSSPIHRGVFVAKSLLGRRLRQPPDDVKPLTEEFNPKMTTRERVAHQTRETACMNCHSVINPLGFSLENYDAVGRFRTEEKKKPIDVSSVYNTPDGEKVELNGARDLAEFLANNKTAQRSFIQQLFNHYAKQSLDAYGDGQLDKIHQRFVENEFNIQKLLVDISLMFIEHK